jgi:hypothetical protein
LLLSFWSNAQNGITYQAVILNPNTEELPGADNSRLPLVNQKITLEFKILNATSTIDYQETINTETDEFGMVNVIIGTGTRKAGIASRFSAINWDGSPKTLIVALDSTGDSTRFIEISDQPFTYVPYALYAANGGSTGAQGPVGPAGNNGLDGKTVLNGNTNPSASIGTNGDFYINTTANSLFGPKTNDIWGNGVSLVGSQGIQGATGLQGTAGTNGTNGSNGNDGLSAYQIWLNAGNTGTEVQFVTALRGASGTQGQQGIQGLQGPIGLTGATGPQGVAGTNGTNGLSAYQIWINAGNTGTEAQFLNSIRGATGAQGPQGIQGVQGLTGLTGATGPQGNAGTNGTNGSNGNDGLSAYQIWLNSGNTGTEAQFLTALLGATGAQGIQGIQGTTGTNGKNSLINTTTEAAGNNCVNGGVKIEVGLDLNNNGNLESNEVENSKTKFLCVQNNNSNLTIQQRLDLGESPFSIVNSGVPINNIYGKTYQGGLIFHIDMVNSRGLVVTNYNVTGQKCFGCINIDISTSSDLYSGLQNTLNFITNGCDGYSGSVRACYDLVYNGYDDWFLPSSGECNAIIGNIPSWTLTEFWSSTQGPNSGYQLFATGNAGRNDGGYNRWCYGITRAVRIFTNQ